MIRVCAILAVYNEADIVVEAVTKLIAGGVDVFVIDNGSTDGTPVLLQSFVGHGVIDIQYLNFQEDGRAVYNWTAILKYKQDLAQRLGYDWYLHVDGDEIRYAPWPGLSLREGIDKVDYDGYNLINFKLFNFRLSKDIGLSDDYERDMANYSIAETYNQRQIKAWKAHPAVDIVSHGGHFALRPDARIYPLRFIHKHYPVRSLEHARRKIILERKNRFSKVEIQRGWHVQYNELTEVSPEEVFRRPEELIGFELNKECCALLAEAADIGCKFLRACDKTAWGDRLEVLLPEWSAASGVDLPHARELIRIASYLMEILGKGRVQPMSVGLSDAQFLRHAMSFMAAQGYLSGDASLMSDVTKQLFVPT